MALDLENLSMTEIIRLQDQLSQVLKRRFEKKLGLGFTDVVNSSAYFSRFGDEAGRALQQRHFDLLGRVLPKHGGRVVDTAGDGAFLCFPSAEAAVLTAIDLQTALTLDNQDRQREHQLVLRIGLHFGSVLTDGQLVTGDSVNLCARVAATAAPGEIRLTREAFHELPSVVLRLACRPVGPVELKGIARSVELLTLTWRGGGLYPTRVHVVETGEMIPLPELDVISFGRLREHGGVPANDVVLTHPDPDVIAKVSRWHFELRRHPDRFHLRAVSDQLTEVDGTPVAKGQQVAIGTRSEVRLGRALTLQFDAPEADTDAAQKTNLLSPP